MEPRIIIFGLIVLALLSRLIAGAMDRERITNYVHKQGWTLKKLHWDPFGPGWYGEKDARIYQLVYQDAEGRNHRAHVKTSMWSGVYLTKDEVASTPSPSVPGTSMQALQDENEQLKRRIAELEQA